jgi:hypothetical protein
MSKQLAILKKKDYLTPYLVKLVTDFITTHRLGLQDTTIDDENQKRLNMIVHNLENVLQHNNNDLQITNVRNCIEPFTLLLQNYHYLTFQEDFLRLLINILFSNEHKSMHKHIIIMFNKFVTVDSEIRKIIVDIFRDTITKFIENAFKGDSTYDILDYELHTFEFVWETDSFFGDSLDVTLVPFIQKAYTCLNHQISLILSADSHNSQKSLFTITGFLKLVMSILRKRENIFKQCLQVTDQTENAEIKEITHKLQQITNELIPRIVTNEKFTRDGSRSAILFIFFLLDLAFEGDKRGVAQFLANTVYSVRVSFTDDNREKPEVNTLGDIFTNIILNRSEKEMNNLMSAFSMISYISSLGALFNVFNHSVTMQTLSVNDTELHFALDIILPELIEICSAQNSREQVFAVQVLNSATIELKQYIQTQLKNKQHIAHREKYVRIVEQILSIVWDNWENSTHNLYEKVRDQFVILLDIHDVLVRNDPSQGSGLDLDAMTKQLLDLDFNRKGKYHPLLNLLPRVGGTQFLHICPDLFDKILSVIGNGMVNTQASLLYELLAKDLFASNNITKKVTSGDALESVQQRVLLPVCKYLLGNGESAQENNHSQILIYIVPKVLKLHPLNFKYLFQSVQKQGSQITPQSDAYLSAVTQLLVIAKSESLPNAQDEIRNNLPLVQVCFKHFDPNLRIESLNLITLSIKTTEVCTKLELEMALEFIRLNLKPPSSGFRSSLLAIMRRFIGRITTSCHFIWTKLEDKDNTRIQVLRDAISKAEQGHDIDSASKEVAAFGYMMVFIKKLLLLLQRSMYGGVPHDKLLIALALYELVYSNIYKQAFISQLYDEFTWLHSPQFLTQLLNQFVSCWDKVRSIIFNLVVLMQDSDFVHDSSFISHVIQRSLGLSSSGRLRESDAGALLLNFVFARFVVRDRMNIQWSYNDQNQVIVNITSSDNSDNSSSILLFLNNLLRDLERRIANIKTDIMRICLDSPVTGILLTMRYTFSNFDLTNSINSENRNEWKQFAVDLFRLNTELMNATLIMVGKSKDVDCRGHIQMSNPLAHKLTVNSWLAVKESCALMGTFTQCVPLTNNDPVFSEEQFSELGQLFLKILLHCKHNGAIEKSAVGFAMTCSSLLRCELPNLAPLPSQWLKYLLDRIVTSDDKDSILRRSAGVPFSFMAILRSEPEGVPRVLLPHTMNHLFSITDLFYEGKCGEHTMVHAGGIILHLSCNTC